VDFVCAVMSEARALTSTMSNAVACVVVSIWENACDRDVLKRELTQERRRHRTGAGRGGDDRDRSIGNASPMRLH
jgi:aerobic C4-dicarboxylate transport protein